MTDLFNWIPTQTAPRNAPAFVIQGSLDLAGGGSVQVPDGRLATSGWGQIGSIDLIEPLLKPLPIALHLRWFCLVTRQGWQGSFAFDLGLLQPWFRSGLPGPTQFDPVSKLILGMAPGGTVAVWLLSRRVTLPIGLFQADPCDVAASEVSPDAADSLTSMAEDRLAALLTPTERALPVQPGWWARIAKPYGFRPLLQPHCREATLWTTALDGTCDWFDLEQVRGGPSVKPGQVHGISSSLGLTWRKTSGAMMVATAEFDPDEALIAFESLAPLGALELLMQPADTDTDLALFLRAGSSIYRFAKARTSVWQR